jgi:hypothetical protein
VGARASFGLQRIEEIGDIFHHQENYRQTDPVDPGVGSE